MNNKKPTKDNDSQTIAGQLVGGGSGGHGLPAEGVQLPCSQVAVNTGQCLHDFFLVPFYPLGVHALSSPN